MTDETIKPEIEDLNRLSAGWTPEIKAELVKLQMESYDRGCVNSIDSIVESLKRTIETTGDIKINISSIIQTIESTNAILNSTRTHRN